MNKVTLSIVTLAAGAFAYPAEAAQPGFLGPPVTAPGYTHFPNPPHGVVVKPPHCIVPPPGGLPGVHGVIIRPGAPFGDTQP
jgi:hypothetical protein